jgi:hypothetical protein
VLARPKLALGSPPGRIANLELAEEMTPLVFDLTGRDRHGAVPALSVFDLRGVELVPALAGLIENTGEVALHCGYRVPSSEEALELRVIPVAARRAAKHGPGEQALAPESDEPSGVQVSGVEGP